MLRNCFLLGLLCFSQLSAGRALERTERRQERVVARELDKLERARKKQASIIEGYLNQERRKAALLERTAAIEAWRDRMDKQYTEDISFGKYAHLYVTPAWPAALQLFNSTHQCMMEYEISRANRSFTSRGGVRDIAALELGDKPTMGDLLWSSARAKESTVTPAAGYEFLNDLADTQMIFSASHVTRAMNLSYAFSMRNNTLTVGLVVPFLERMRHMRVHPDVSSAVRTQLRSTATAEGAILVNQSFRELYGINVQTFIEDIISQKGMRFEPHVHQFTVGDIECFATVNLFPHRLERCQVGVQLTAPVAKETDDRFFYPLLLGNGGFFALKGYASVLGQKTKYGSLHAMTSLEVGLPATVTRRVPRYVSYASKANEIYGDEISGTVSTDTATETTISAFAGQTTSVTLRPGAKFDLRIGSVILPFISHAYQADIYYHLHIQFEDELQKGLPAELWYTDDLVANTSRSQHQVGMQLSWQPDANFHVRVGGYGTFAGTSAPMTWTGTMSLSCEW